MPKAKKIVTTPICESELVRLQKEYAELMDEYRKCENHRRAKRIRDVMMALKIIIDCYQGRDCVGQVN